MQVFDILRYTVRLGQSRAFRRFGATPLIAEPTMSWCPGYMSLDEALSSGSLSISEITAAGSVQDLCAANEADEPVLILDGEVLRGAKQNRISNATMLLPPRSRTTIPVSCVEAGRWSYREKVLAASNHTFFLAGRARKAESVSRSITGGNGRRGDQRRIWSDIDDLLSAMQVHSPTSSICDAYDHSSALLDLCSDAFVPTAHQVGLIYSIDGIPLGLDLFGSPDIFDRSLPKLIRGAALQLHESRRARQVDHCSPELFWQAVTSANTSAFPAVGLGLEHRICEPAISGGAIFVDNRLVHLYAFPRSTILKRFGPL